MRQQLRVRQEETIGWYFGERVANDVSNTTKYHNKTEINLYLTENLRLIQYFSLTYHNQYKSRELKLTINRGS